MSEEILDLDYKGLKLYQDNAGYCFTSDAVLLANYIRCKKTDKVCEFCAGSGVISVLLSKKQEPGHIYAFEFQTRLADMFTRSVKLNKLEDKITVYDDRLENCLNYLKAGSMDVVYCNPPYTNATQDRSDNKEIAIATHEIETNLESVISSVAKLLKFGGKLYMVHKAERLVDVLSTLRKYKIEPKKLCMVYPKPELEPAVFLVEAKLGGKHSLRVHSAIFAEDFKYSKNSF